MNKKATFLEGYSTVLFWTFAIIIGIVLIGILVYIQGAGNEVTDKIGSELPFVG